MRWKSPALYTMKAIDEASQLPSGSPHVYILDGEITLSRGYTCSVEEITQRERDLGYRGRYLNILKQKKSTPMCGAQGTSPAHTILHG